jgi:multimeric flavodoxin WrbA
MAISRYFIDDGLFNSALKPTAAHESSTGSNAGECRCQRLETQVGSRFFPKSIRLFRHHIFGPELWTLNRIFPSDKLPAHTQPHFFMNEMNRRLFLGAAAASVAAFPGFANAAGPAAGSVKIIGIVGSLRKGKSTYKAMELALESAKTVSPAIATDIIELSGLNLDPYIAVGSKSSDRPDDFPAVREKLVAQDVFGILMGSPVYMGIVSSPLKQLFERMLAFRQGGFPLKNKVGGALAVGGGRNTGVELILQQLIMFMLSQEMILVGDGSPGDHWGGTMQSQGEELSKDEGSLNTLRGVGKRVAEIALRMAASAKQA